MAFVTAQRTEETVDLTTDAQGNRTIYQIPEMNYAKFIKDIAKLSKRAKRLVGENIDIIKIGEKFVGEPAMRVFDVYLAAPAPVVGDFSFVATIDHTNETGNVIRTVPNFRCDLPEEYRTAEPMCDHCRVKRMRRDTFVLWNARENQFQQVGSTCLESALGYNPFAAAKMAELLGYADEAAKANREIHGTAYMNDYRWVNVEDYLQHVANQIRIHGWVSGTTARERDIISTRQMAMTSYMGGQVEIPLMDKETAEKALEWARSLRDSDEELNQYLHNISVVAGSEYVESRSTGLAASIIYAYNRNVVCERPSEANSKHVGKVGDRVKAVCTVIGVSGFESNFGYSHIYRFISETGNVVCWFTTTSQKINKGDRVLVTGTVKNHTTYRNVAQTVLTRCKVEAQGE